MDSFSEIEETVSFYTRNDYAVINSLLAGDYEALVKCAEIADGDNRAVLAEYENGSRTIDGDYDRRWIEILRKRLIDGVNTEAGMKRVKETAERDIRNLLGAMKPSGVRRLLYRTAWRGDATAADRYIYSGQYLSLSLAPGYIIEIKTISSTSTSPYREDEDENEAYYTYIPADFYRYEITVPENGRLLELDGFECHNEDGEVLLPPMKCRVNNIREGKKKRCAGVIKLEYMGELS